MHQTLTGMEQTHNHVQTHYVTRMSWKPKTKLIYLATKFWMNTKIFEILVTHSCHKDKHKSVWKLVLLSRIQFFFLDFSLCDHSSWSCSLFLFPFNLSDGARDSVFSSSSSLFQIMIICPSPVTGERWYKYLCGRDVWAVCLLTICLGRSSCHFLLSLLLSAHWGYVTCAPASCWPCLSAWASLFFSVYLCFCVRPNLCQCPQCWQQGYVFKFMHKGPKVSNIPDCLLAFQTLIKICYFGTFAACNIWSNCQKAFWPMPDWSSSHSQICWFYNYFVNLLLNHQKVYFFCII